MTAAVIILVLLAVAAIFCVREAVILYHETDGGELSTSADGMWYWPAALAVVLLIVFALVAAFTFIP